MKPLFTILFLLFLLNGLHSQTSPRHQLFLDMGYSFNKEVTLAETPVNNSRAGIVTIGGTYQLFSFRKFNMELGFATKTVFSNGTIGKKSFDATTLRLGMPVNFVFNLSEKWDFAAGLFLQNNVDFEEFDFRMRDKYSWRLNAVPAFRYRMTRFWQLTLKADINLRNLPDAYILNDPNIGFSVGISRFLFSKK
ncbi:MAG: hypothetical protein AB8F74_08940 [Saprospiraceae bacterium]